MPNASPPRVEVHDRFRRFNHDLKDIWASYVFLSYYLPKIHESIKQDTFPPFELDSLSGIDSKHVRNKNHTFGVLSHIERKVVPVRTLISAVACTEDFLKDLCVIVYSRYPAKLSTSEGEEPSEQGRKLLQTIIASSTREEIIAKLIDERVRGIFYGNVADFFTKIGKTRLEFGSHFSDNHQQNLKHLREIIARRNIYSHNDGRVDAKYLRETESAPFKKDQRAPITRTYLRHSLIVLRGLSAVAADLVCKNAFKSGSAMGTLKKVAAPFERYYSDAARKTSGPRIAP